MIQLDIWCQTKKFNSTQKPVTPYDSGSDSATLVWTPRTICVWLWVIVCQSMSRSFQSSNKNVT